MEISKDGEVEIWDGEMEDGELGGDGKERGRDILGDGELGGDGKEEEGIF